MEKNRSTQISQSNSESNISAVVGKKKILWILVSLGILVAIIFVLNFFVNESNLERSLTKGSGSPVQYQNVEVNVPFERQDVNIKPEISKNFSVSEIKNIKEIEKAYGFKFTQSELNKLEQNKFVIKNLMDTNITGPDGLAVENDTREFAALYKKITGGWDYRSRNQANSVFVSSDSMMNLLSILSAELLKETENKYLYEDVFSMTKTMYEESSSNLRKAGTPDEKKEWTKIRNYFAVPYTLLSTHIKPITPNDYWESDYRQKGLSADEMMSDFKTKDKDADSIANMTAFVKNLKLDSDSEAVVLADIKKTYEASLSRGAPSVFESEFAALPPLIRVQIPFTLFKPRGTYTSSSLRRQYFRAIQWYQQIPFLVNSPDLTKYAVDIGGLLQQNKNIENQYKSFSSLIAFIVGESDDLDLSDYAAAVNELGIKKAHDYNSLNKFLDKSKPEAKIKAMPVDIDPNSGITVEDEMKALRGMRFMSSKFIPDSYWTSKLTQGDEDPIVSGQKLPSMASMIQVMSILGSPYATSRLPDLPFYIEHKQAVDTKLAELKNEANGWDENYWKSNFYTSNIWTVSGMFDWLTKNKSSLPQFMQSPLWEAKTLLTGAGFWTELRHTSLLYAKQSFAEKGGGGDCDPREIPEPPKGYVEPQAEAYDRLYYTARRLAAEYKARGFELSNQQRLDNYIDLLNTVREYTKLELENASFSESYTSEANSYEPTCIEHNISPESKIKRDGYESASRWEELRSGLVNRMLASLPIPVEGPIVEMKDKRAAVVADIHTDKEGNVLEEGTGVPRVIFVAIKDANGPRLTVGFTYSQYEVVTPGERLTDEEWQSRFYTDSATDYSITYKPKSSWPEINKWFQELLGSK